MGLVYSLSDDTRPGATGKRSLQIDTTDAFTYTNWIRRSVYGVEGSRKYRISIWCKIVGGGHPDGPIENVIAQHEKKYTNQNRIGLFFDMTVDRKRKHVSCEFTVEQFTTADDFYTLVVNPVP